MSFEKTKKAVKKILNINDDIFKTLPLIHLINQASAWAFVYYDEIDSETKNIIKSQMIYLKEKGTLDENI